MVLALAGMICVASVIEIQAQGCPSPNPYCDSVTSTDCFVACPAGDETWIVILKDSCGNPVCDTMNSYLDFTNCSATPCAGYHPNWPIVRADSCRAATGEHFYTIHAGGDVCEDCSIDVVVAGVVCTTRTTRFTDTDGDGTVTQADFQGGLFCADFDCGNDSEPSDSLIWAVHMGHSCSGIPAGTCCEHHLAVQADMSPSGVPDFDQKQNQPAWSDGINPTHCGPVAVANGLWWFDSRLDGINIPPPTVSDGYPLVTPYGGWDDHDPQNVEPLVSALATLMNTNNISKGTEIDSLVSGTKQFIAAAGLAGGFTDTLVQWPDYNFISDKLLDSCVVTLLLGFYEQNGCCRIGGHYVTVAGACTTLTKLCISDPWFDILEGEPPAGAAHGPIDHNDPTFVSGPHGQIQHDDFALTPTELCVPSTAQRINWPFDQPERVNFLGQNKPEGASPCSPDGSPVITIIEYAWVLCSDSLVVSVIEPDDADLPSGYELLQNYPNPFNTSTMIKYRLTESAFVTMELFNVLGQHIRTLVRTPLGTGEHQVEWDGRDHAGVSVSSGIYFYRLTIGETNQIRKMLLLK